jgi:aminoglycoside 2''-phosphotransferase
MNNTIEIYLKEINNIYPDLTLREIHLLDPDGGQYNDVLTAETTNGPLIFRFPRNEIGVTAIQNELRILRSLQNKTTLPIPNPIYTNQNSQTPGQIFMGYPMLPGRPLLRKHLKTAVDHATLKKWAVQMSEFLIQLHNLPTTIFNNLPHNETTTEFQTLYADIRQLLFPYMSQRAKSETADHFENYFNTPALQNYPIALRHGDFGSGNILYDPLTLNLTGVIDFGFSGLGDPAIDIAALSTLNDTFFNFVQKSYPNIEPLLARARFYKGTYLLYEALYGLKTGNQKIFHEAIAPYIH